jgi:hypothetical protein
MDMMKALPPKLRKEAEKELAKLSEETSEEETS